MKFSSRAKHREEVGGIIMRAELISSSSGVSAYETIAQYAKELKKTNKRVSSSLSEVSRLLQGHQKRWDAYKQYLDADILKLLKKAEEKSIPSASIFEKYAPLKKMAQEHESSIKKGLVRPLIMFVVLSLLFSVVVTNFEIINTVSTTKLSALSMFIMNNFAIITGSIFVLFIYLFFVVPQKTPMLSGIYKKIKGLLVLSTTVTMNEIGYGSGEIIPEITEIFGLQRKKRKGIQDSGALVEILLLNEIITPIEGADIKIGIEYGEFQRASSDILGTKYKSVNNLGEEIGKLMSSLSVLLMAIPVLLTIIVFAEVMSIVTGGVS